MREGGENKEREFGSAMAEEKPKLWAEQTGKVSHPQLHRFMNTKLEPSQFTLKHKPCFSPDYLLNTLFYFWRSWCIIFLSIPIFSFYGCGNSSLLSKVFHGKHPERIDLLLKLFFYSCMPQRRFAVEKLSLQKDSELMSPQNASKKNSLTELKVVRGTEFLSSLEDYFWQSLPN